MGECAVSVLTLVKGREAHLHNLLAGLAAGATVAGSLRGRGHG